MKIFYFYFLFIFSFINCTTSAPLPDRLPIHETIKIKSKILSETRTINIWTPATYLRDNKPLPVFYMPDGGVQEDFPHVANSLAKLIAAKKIPPVILVGIENTQRRRDLTGPTDVAEDKKIAPIVGGSANFRSFIKTELMPEINKSYLTNAKNGIMGESLAGLFVTETLFIEPDLFDYYIALDPSIWWNNHELERTAKDRLAHFSTKEKRFWFVGSNTPEIYTHTRNLSVILKQKKLPTIEWMYSEEPKQNHSTIYRATKEKALIWTLNKSQ